MRSLLPIVVLCSATGTAAMAEVPDVVVDILPVHSLVSTVMEGVGAPRLLIDQGADPHHVTLKPSQAKALQDADLVVWIGPEMTPWLSRAIEGTQTKAAQVALLHSEGTFLRDFASDESEGHGHTHEGQGHSGHDHAGHDHSGHGHAAQDHAGHDHGHSHDGHDPHAWLDPANARHWLGVIAQALGAQDPENAARYSENANAAQMRLTVLDAEIATELAPLSDRAFIVAHDAYGYLTAHYGLSAVGSLASGDAAAPGAAHLRQIQAELDAKGVVCAFPEVGRDAAMLRVAIEGSTVKLGDALDPEGRGLAAGPALYETLLRQTTAALVGCLTP